MHTGIVRVVIKYIYQQLDWVRRRHEWHQRPHYRETYRPLIANIVIE